MPTSAKAGQEVVRLLYTEDSPRGEGSEAGGLDEDSHRLRRQGERLAVFDAAVAEMAERVLPAYRAADCWLERTRAGLLALLGAFDELPETARLLVGDSIAWGPEVLERRGELLEALAGALDDPRGKIDPVESLPETAGENLVGASLSWIHARLQGGDGRFIELTPSLMSMIVHTYLGAEAAQWELERPLAGLGVVGLGADGVGAEAAGRESEGQTPRRASISRLRATPS